MKNKILLILGFVLPATAFPLESIYVGVQAGQVFLSPRVTPTFNDALGFGGELGFRTNPMLLVSLRSQISSHSGGAGTSLWANTLTADVLVGNVYDIEIFAGAGPGFYSFSSNGTARFGLVAEVFGDLMVSDVLRLGLATRYNAIFNTATDEAGFWSIMMRVGFSFNN